MANISFPYPHFQDIDLIANFKRERLTKIKNNYDLNLVLLLLTQENISINYTNNKITLY